MAKKKSVVLYKNKVDGLTPRQRDFVEKYLQSLKDPTITDGKDKVLFAYDTTSRRKIGNPIPTDKRRATKAYWVLKHPAVQAYLRKVDERVAAKTVVIADKYVVTKEKIIEELAKIAMTNVTDLLEYGEDGITVKPSSELGDAAAAITEVSEYETKAGLKRVKIKTADKRAALETLGKALGVFTEKHEHKHLSVNFVIEKE